MSDKTMEMLIEWGWAGVTLIVGLVITTIIVMLVRKTLSRT